MALVINTNIASLTAQRNLAESQSVSATAMERLSSGLRINSARDDAAGLAIANRFSAQSMGLAVGARNAGDGVSLAQTAEGALQEVTDNLLRMRELAVQASNASLSGVDRASLQTEFDALRDEIQRVGTSTTFNGNNLLNGDFTGQIFQVGANAGDRVTMGAIQDTRTSALGQFTGVQLTNVSIGTATDTGTALTVNIAGGGALALGTIAIDASVVANALNSLGQGITATARASQLAAGTSAASGPAADSDTFTLNGVTVTLTHQGNVAGNRTHAVEQINAVSAQTGVVATDTGAGVQLDSAEGRNITVSAVTAGGTSATTGAGYGLNLTTGSTTGARIDIVYTAQPNQTGSVVFAGTNFMTGNTSTAIQNSGTAIDGLDISAVGAVGGTGALAAINSIDNSLARVDTSRANLGATQARFESVISSAMIARESAEASRSRIMDADFAAETANMTKGQILQQAGISVLAQANAMPQQVLSLLQ